MSLPDAATQHQETRVHKPSLPGPITSSTLPASVSGGGWTTVQVSAGVHLLPVHFVLHTAVDSTKDQHIKNRPLVIHHILYYELYQWVNPTEISQELSLIHI